MAGSRAPCPTTPPDPTRPSAPVRARSRSRPTLLRSTLLPSTLLPSTLLPRPLAAVDPAAVDPPEVAAPAVPRARRHRAARPTRPHPRARRAMLAGLALAVALLVAAGVLVLVHHDDKGTPAAPSAASDPAVAAITRGDLANAFVAGASTDIAAVTTYDYRSLDSALSNGSAVTTGAYRTSFRAALTGPLAADAVRVKRVQTFRLLDAGIGSIDADGTGAKVLIFGLQSVTDATTGGRPRTTPVTLTATVSKQGNRYLLARWTRPERRAAAGTAGLRAAAEAGREEVLAVLTLRHDHFDTDYGAALAGAVDPLRSSLTGQAAAARARITAGRYDLAGTVTAVGVERADGGTLVLLVAATGTRTPVGGTPTVVVDGRYRVTVVHAGGTWVTSAIDSAVPS